MSIANEVAPWEKFSGWVHCICVVTFDLELGQALEVIYPGDARLSGSEKLNICYLSFPDSNSSCAADTVYHFRIRRVSKCLNATHVAYSERVLPTADLDPTYYYGFVHFRQRKDASLPRGYYQKSLVLITSYPIFNLFYHVVSMVAAAYFESGEPAVEAACHHIDHWPAPTPGECLTLPLMGAIIQCYIPCKNDTPLETKFIEKAIGSPSPLVLNAVNETNLFKELRGFLSHIQLLWELVLVGEPLVVMAPCPSTCALLVESLISLIWPLRYCNDYRPYFTIHDSEFKEYTLKGNSPPSVMLGVTNPFFIKTLQHWPHILRIGDESSEQLGVPEKSIRRTLDGRLFDMKPGLYSQYRTFLYRDKSLLKKLLKNERDDSVLSSVLRRHMLELTQSFMIPLERYLSSLMPLQKHMSPFRAIPQARPFSVDDFLSSLSEAGPGLTCCFKGDWKGLYGKFMLSKNFEGWLRSRQKDIARQLRLSYIEVLCKTDFSAEILQEKQQVEIVDLVLKISNYIESLSDTQIELRRKLQSQLRTILQSVDDELKTLLLSNCDFRSRMPDLQ
uniref:UDENN domain-containing protein n=1 Tax=Syphacia muris TaxID=451379 RepID=A0A158R609_9BILA